MPNQSQTTKGTTVSENSGTGVETSKAQSSVSSGVKSASYAELELALLESQRANQALQHKVQELERNTSTDNSAINKLAEAIAQMAKPAVEAHGPTQSDNINRVDDFGAKATVDGRSLMEAQQTLQMFRDEVKKPISIPKSMANKFGPTLSVTVNGVRVSIPCDGKTYYINETHYEHARERMSKVDALDFGSDQNIVEIG